VVDTALDAVLGMDEQGRITEWNAQAETMFGWRREEAVGRRLSERLIPARYWSDHEEGLRRFLTSGEGPILNRRVEITALRRNGSEFPVELSVASYRIGGSWAFSGFVRDVTERKTAETAVRESEARYREVQMTLAHANRVATMGQLSASIAHEINQPISASITYAKAGLRWLRAQPPDLEEVRQALSHIVGSAGRADDVISRVRALYKKEPPRNESLEINEAVLEVIALVSGEAAKNGVSVQTQLAERLPAVCGDRVQLQQVILNLLINSIDAMSGRSEEPRELLISTMKADPDGVLVAVQDSGPGFAPESVDRLFEPFYTTKLDGLGMGLSICRSIIEAHEGRLWATANVSRGAIFQFTLPAHPSSKECSLEGG
jgi:PAS domain S-box-containing protein